LEGEASTMLPILYPSLRNLQALENQNETASSQLQNIPPDSPLPTISIPPRPQLRPKTAEATTEAVETAETTTGAVKTNAAATVFTDGPPTSTYGRTTPASVYPLIANGGIHYHCHGPSPLLPSLVSRESVGLLYPPSALLLPSRTQSNPHCTITGNLSRTSTWPDNSSMRGP